MARLVKRPMYGVDVSSKRRPVVVRSGLYKQPVSSDDRRRADAAKRRERYREEILSRLSPEDRQRILDDEGLNS